LQFLAVHFETRKQDALSIGVQIEGLSALACSPLKRQSDKPSLPLNSEPERPELFLAGLLGLI
jgi:hypothetical protein